MNKPPKSPCIPWWSEQGSTAEGCVASGQLFSMCGENYVGTEERVVKRLRCKENIIMWDVNEEIGSYYCTYSHTYCIMTTMLCTLMVGKVQ